VLDQFALASKGTRRKLLDAIVSSWIFATIGSFVFLRCLIVTVGRLRQTHHPR
jgi:hypothetical protein